MIFMSLITIMTFWSLRKPYFSKVQLCRQPVIGNLCRLLSYLDYLPNKIMQYSCRHCCYHCDHGRIVRGEAAPTAAHPLWSCHLGGQQYLFSPGQQCAVSVYYFFMYSIYIILYMPTLKP